MNISNRITPRLQSQIVFLLFVLFGSSGQRVSAETDQALAVPDVTSGTAINPRVGTPIQRQSVQALPTASPSLHVPVLADSWWHTIYRPFESGLASRARMLQLGVLVMLAALWIIWWRK
jgi:hypothetical protein